MSDVVIVFILTLEFVAIFFGVIMVALEIDRKDDRKDGLEKKIDK